MFHLMSLESIHQKYTSLWNVWTDFFHVIQRILQQAALPKVLRWKRTWWGSYCGQPNGLALPKIHGIVFISNRFKQRMFLLFFLLFLQLLFCICCVLFVNTMSLFCIHTTFCCFSQFFERVCNVCVCVSVQTNCRDIVAIVTFFLRWFCVK